MGSGLTSPDLSLYFRALADRKRLQIAQYLSQHEEVTVTQLGTELRLSQPLISWHLRMLRRAGVVKTRKSGRMVFCSLNRQTLIRYQERVSALFTLDGQADRDGDDSSRLLEAASG
jgi:DNA-binding transcriptional ArsR family regulator